MHLVPHDRKEKRLQLQEVQKLLLGVVMKPESSIGCDPGKHKHTFHKEQTGK